MATLAASESPELFSAVAAEVGNLFEVPGVELVRYEPDSTATVVAGWGPHPYPVGSNWRLDGPSVTAMVLDTGRPARIDDYTRLPGSIADAARTARLRCTVAAPILLGEKVWGALAVGSKDGILPPDTESRLVGFAELVATAIANAESREALSRLAAEQAALRRVATLVAEGATPTVLFSAVAEEVARVLDVALAAVVRYDVDHAATQVGAWGDQNPVRVGMSWKLDECSVSGLVAATRLPARVVDYAKVPGEIANALARDAGIRSAVGAPILVGGNLWGVMMAFSTHDKPLPNDAETRLAAFTELIATAISNADARDDLRGLVDEQAALHRVATLVARGADAAMVFDAVCIETCRLIGSDSANLSHLSPDGVQETMAGWSLRGIHLPVGTRAPLAPDTLGYEIFRTRAPARRDSYEGATSELGRLIHSRGFRSTLGTPIIVEGRLWGALFAGTTGEKPLPADSEQRIARFTELVATAVSNAEARSQLIASRARIVAAGDEARRRIERDLHDGAQQRLVSLALAARAAAAERSTPSDVRDKLERIASGLITAVEELQELSRGIHPAILSDVGLRAALEALALRSPIPVVLEVMTRERFPEPVEVAVYFVASESLANAAKHSHSTRVDLALKKSKERLLLSVRDDGVGGADPTRGTGLVGLRDRVEAVGGLLELKSTPGHGTRLDATFPIAP